MPYLPFCTIMSVLIMLSGAIVTCHTGSNSNDFRHRIFVTSTTFNGNLGGLDGADIICTNVAADTGISGSYRAILSSSTDNAITRLNLSGEVYKKSTHSVIRVARSGTAFWNNDLQNTINVDENKATLTGMEGPWTGTNPGGGASLSTCMDWTDGTAGSFGTTGDTSTTQSAIWISANSFPCSEMRPLYCVEE